MIVFMHTMVLPTKRLQKLEQCHINHKVIFDYLFKSSYMPV